jgi:hypothetical protein
MRFFNPRPTFWKWFEKEFKSQEKAPIIDCGCGEGHLVRELRQKKYPALGCDPMFFGLGSDDLDLIGCVLTMPAQELPMVRSHRSIILVCRPCHSGFPAQLNLVRHPDSRMFYIGLEKNLEFDLEPGTYKLASRSIVGEDGEKIWKISKKPE